MRARRVDVIVVHKVDRLTRALSDFAKLVELFDGHGVSFVSVTQAFNTSAGIDVTADDDGRAARVRFFGLSLFRAEDPPRQIPRARADPSEAFDALDDGHGRAHAYPLIRVGAPAAAAGESFTAPSV